MKYKGIACLIIVVSALFFSFGYANAKCVNSGLPAGKGQCIEEYSYGKMFDSSTGKPCTSPCPCNSGYVQQPGKCVLSGAIIKDYHCDCQLTTVAAKAAGTAGQKNATCFGGTYDYDKSKMPDNCNAFVTTMLECKGKPKPGKCGSTGVDSSDIEATDPKAIKRLLSTLDYTKITSPSQIIGRIIKLAMQFIGVIVLALYIYAGVLWMTASGQSEKIDKVKKIFIWTTLGLLALIGSYVSVDFIFDNLINK